MNWQFVMECLGVIALCELAALLPAYLLWRVEGSRTCDVTMTLKDVAEYAAHFSATQELPSPQSSTEGTRTSSDIPPRLLSRLANYWRSGPWRRACAALMEFN